MGFNDSETEWKEDSSLQETQKGQEDQNLKGAQGNGLNQDSRLAVVTQTAKNPGDESIQEKLFYGVLIHSRKGFVFITHSLNIVQIVRL